MTEDQHLYRIEVALKPDCFDAAGRAARAALAAAGLADVTDVREVRVYTVGGAFDRAAAEAVAGKLLTDPVIEHFALDAPVVTDRDGLAIEVVRRPGVMDPVQASIKKGAAELGHVVDTVRTSRRFIVSGGVAPAALRAAALGIAILGPEGLATTALTNADILCRNILDALDLLLKTNRLRATLRV